MGKIKRTVICCIVMLCVGFLWQSSSVRAAKKSNSTATWKKYKGIPDVDGLKRIEMFRKEKDKDQVKICDVSLDRAKDRQSYELNIDLKKGRNFFFWFSKQFEYEGSVFLRSANGKLIYKKVGNSFKLTNHNYTYRT